MYYSLTKDFKALADYGVNLNYPFEDDDDNISTVNDYVLHKIKTSKGSYKVKFKKIFKILRQKKAKSCNDQPELKCTATYPLIPAKQ